MTIKMDKTQYIRHLINKAGLTPTEAEKVAQMLQNKGIWGNKR